MATKTLEILAVLMTSLVLCRAQPDLKTKGNVNFYRDGQNITATWKKLDKPYKSIVVKYCDVTPGTTSPPCMFHNVTNVKDTKVTFRVQHDFQIYECYLFVYDFNGVTYSSPRMAAKFQPDMKDVTFTQKDKKIVGTWPLYGPSYTSLKVKCCAGFKSTECDFHDVAKGKKTAKFKLNDKRRFCSLLVTDVTGEIHFSTPVEVKSDSLSTTAIVIIVVVVLIVVVLVAVAVILYFVLRNYCFIKDTYSLMPTTKKEQIQSAKKRRKSVEGTLSDDDLGMYRQESGYDNEVFVDDEKEKENGAVKGPKSKKKNKFTYQEPTIEYSANRASVVLTMDGDDAVSLSSRSTEGDQTDLKGGKLVMKVEDNPPDVVVIQELDRNQRKMSTDLDAISDVIDDADVIVDFKVEAPVDVAPPKADDDSDVKMGGVIVEPDQLDGDTAVLNDIDIEITPPPQNDPTNSDTSSRNSDDGIEPASRGSIDLSDTRFHDPRYDGSFDLRFAGLSRSESVESDDLEGYVKAGYEPIESEEDSNVMDVGPPTYLKAQASLDSVEELNFDLPYSERFQPEDPDGGNLAVEVDIDSPPIDSSGNIPADLASVEPTTTLDIEPFDFENKNDVTPGAVVDADRDGGLIHVQDEKPDADVEIPAGEVSFDTPDEQINDDNAENGEQSDLNENEPKRKISRKCSKLGKPDHVCSHVIKERRVSRSDSSSSSCSTCTSKSGESSSPTFSRSSSNSGSDTEKDVKDIEDEVDEVVPDIHGSDTEMDVKDIEDEVVEALPGIHGEKETVSGDVDGSIRPTVEGDAILSVPAGFEDEIHKGEDNLDGGRRASTGLNLDVNLGLG